MPGRPITDQQHRYYMSLRPKYPQKTAAAMAGFSASTGYRAEKDPRLPSDRRRERRHGGGRPDPLAELWNEEILPLLESTPGLRPVSVLGELEQRHPGLDLTPAAGHWNAGYVFGRPSMDPSVRSSSGRTIHRAARACRTSSMRAI
jgi:hypothetical protein